jgi:diaminopimelate decarboxylase
MSNWYSSLDPNQIKLQTGEAAWIVNEDQLKSNLRRLAQFTGSSERIFYPVKANPAIPVLQVLAANGAGADCANLAEVQQALFCGFPINRIAYNSPVQEMKVIEFMLAAGGIVVVDDPSVMRTLKLNWKEEFSRGSIWARVNPLTSVEYANKDNLQELMAHGSESSRFGIPEEDLQELLLELGLPVNGLHLHVGTQMDNLSSFASAMQSLHRMADQLKMVGIEIQHLDIGGGLGIAFGNGQVFPSIEEWATGLNKLRKDYTYYAEPGHALVGDAVILLITIQSIKQSRGKRWAVCNVGTDQLAKITLLKWEHEIYCGDGTYMSQKGEDALAGPLCFAGDVLLHHTDVSNLKTGQSLFITKAGAYLYALSNTFNGRAALPWYSMKTDGSLVLSMQKEDLHGRIFLQHPDWSKRENVISDTLLLDHVHQLQSEYISKTIQNDTYEFYEVKRVGEKRYRFATRVSSPVGFISMPLATRIFADACIVAVLDDAGSAKKDHSVWGQKIMLDYFGNISSEAPFEFFITLSHNYTHHEARKLVVSFETVPRGIQGMVVVNH